MQVPILVALLLGVLVPAAIADPAEDSDGPLNLAMELSAIVTQFAPLDQYIMFTLGIGQDPVSDKKPINAISDALFQSELFDYLHYMMTQSDQIYSKLSWARLEFHQRNYPNHEDNISEELLYRLGMIRGLQRSLQEESKKSNSQPTEDQAKALAHTKSIINAFMSRFSEDDQEVVMEFLQSDAGTYVDQSALFSAEGQCTSLGKALIRFNRLMVLVETIINVIETHMESFVQDEVTSIINDYHLKEAISDFFDLEKRGLSIVDWLQACWSQTNRVQYQELMNLCVIQFVSAKEGYEKGDGNSVDTTVQLLDLMKNAQPFYTNLLVNLLGSESDDAELVRQYMSGDISKSILTNKMYKDGYLSQRLISASNEFGRRADVFNSVIATVMRISFDGWFVSQQHPEQ